MNEKENIIAIGASTGGTEAIRYFLQKFPLHRPAILITQHMPAGFTKSFANNLNRTSDFTVKEGEDGEPVIPGYAYIAPGDKHMEISKVQDTYCIRLNDGELVNRHKPSVDVLFYSMAKHVGKNAVGIIMTGMGKDGAKGLLEMRQAGARTIAQDEKSCVVFGMPQEAIKLKAASRVIALKDLPHRVSMYFLMKTY